MTAAIAFALKHWRAIGAGLGFLILGVMLASARSDASHWHKEADRFEALYHAEQSAHQLTVAGFRKATAEAQAADATHVIQVERKQAVISNEVSHDYQAKLADLRARYDALRVRGKGAPAAADSSGGSVARVPEAGSSASGPDDAAALDPFACEANTLQLGELQAWVTQQQSVRP